MRIRTPNDRSEDDASVTTVVASDTAAEAACSDTLKGLGKGFYWQHLINTGKIADTTEIAKRKVLHQATVNELLRLALLAPAIIASALAGRQPQTVTLEGLLKAALPRAWREQQASAFLSGH